MAAETDSNLSASFQANEADSPLGVL